MTTERMTDHCGRREPHEAHSWTSVMSIYPLRHCPGSVDRGYGDFGVHFTDELVHHIDRSELERVVNEALVNVDAERWRMSPAITITSYLAQPRFCRTREIRNRILERWGSLTPEDAIAELIDRRLLPDGNYVVIPR